MDGAEIVGFHGQTLAHEPRGRGTHQVGNGAALAQALGRAVVWDFRSSDVRLGGEGASEAFTDIFSQLSEHTALQAELPFERRPHGC